MNNQIANPMGNSTALQSMETAGGRQTQSRELAETQAKYMMAQQFPRNVVRAMDNILNAFTRTGLAEKSQYQFSRGGTDICGPSIRAAEAVAQQWGNMEQGWRELSRGIGADGVPFSEVEAYCADLENRCFKRLQFIVKHWRDTKNGGYQIKEERDIYELVANQSQRRVRACILAMIPGDVMDSAMNQAEVTLRTKADTSPEAMVKMVEAFQAFGVGREHIEKRIQRRLESIQPAQVVMLKRVYASLRDEMSSPGDWFDMDAATDAVATSAAAKTAATPYPDEAFAKNLPGWLSMIAAEKKTADQIIAMAQTKHPLSDSQKAAIHAKPAPVAVVNVSFAVVADALHKAADMDALDAAADLIGEVADSTQRAELLTKYDALRAELTA